MEVRMWREQVADADISEWFFHTLEHAREKI